jgi:hypothetical protein
LLTAAGVIPGSIGHDQGADEGEAEGRGVIVE